MCIHFSHKCNANLILLASRFHYINETNNILVLSKYKKHFIFKERQPSLGFFFGLLVLLQHFVAAKNVRVCGKTWGFRTPYNVNTKIIKI